MKELLPTLQLLIYPPKCAGCGRRGTLLCQTCLRECHPHGDGCCPRCGSRVSGSTCVTCLRFIRHLDELRAAYSYSGPVRDLVHRFKYDGLHASADWMAEQMPVAWLPEDAALVPVPLHARRQKERGYNQSELLAKAVGRRTGLPTMRALKRVRYTSPQAQQEGMGRWANIKDAFEPTPSLGGTRVVVLVDDVCTTGATLEECASVLRSHGVEKVAALVFART